MKRDSVKKHDISALNKRIIQEQRKKDNINENSNKEIIDIKDIKEIEENSEEPDSTPISQLPN